MLVEDDDELVDILGYETIAVVGCSATRGKAAHGVPKYLQKQGYTIIPVNPFADEILGREAYDSLADVEEEVDIVDVFRPSEEVAAIVDTAIERGDVKVVWTQLGIRDEDAAKTATDAGLRVVMDRCLKVVHRRLKHRLD